MADDVPDDTPPPALITPLESGYIRIAIGAALPAINWVLYATNLDVVFHIQKLTTNQVWQGVNAGLTVLTVVLTILKRLKEGRDPKSTAPRIVLMKPAPPKDEFADIAKADPKSPGTPHMTDEELLDLIQKRIKK